MALTRKNLMINAEQLAALAERRGTSESAAAREAIATALFAEEFDAAMEGLRATGYGTDVQISGDDAPVPYAPDTNERTPRRS